MGKILIWREYYNQFDIYQRSHVSLSESQQNNLSTVCSYHITYAFQSESKLYSCLHVTYLPWCHNHLVCKQTSDIAPVSGKEFLDTLATIERGFTLKRIRERIST